MKKSFMIIGGNFINKGAQAMVFVTVDELRRRYPDCKIHVYTNLNYRDDQRNYRFRIYDDLFIYMNVWDKFKYFVLATAKAALGRPAAFKSFIAYHYYRKKYTAMLDISGFALYSEDEKGKNRVSQYLKNIRLAQKYRVPVFLMPQSMGPFEFGNYQETMDKQILECLAAVEKIFVREKKGYDFLCNKYGLKNVVLSPDIVLQNKELNITNVFVEPPYLNIPRILCANSVAIVPNLRNFDQMEKDEQEILNKYDFFVKILLSMGKNIYLIRHSHEDIFVCRKIKKLYLHDERVHLIENEMNCLEYETFISKFDYIIGARFHSIVHAYKKGVPAIVVGWAQKYNGLVQLFDQGKYVIDMRKDISEEQIGNLIREISESYKEERKCILESLEDIQQNNCFDILSETLEGIC